MQSAVRRASMAELVLSGRAQDKILRAARTIPARTEANPSGQPTPTRR